MLNTDSFMLLTKQGGILGPFASILGFIMNGIFWVLNKIGIPNTGIIIILFTIVIYVLLLPLTYKQQKFSKFSAKMNPELTAIRDKYKGKNDQDSIMKMNQETQAVYAKYGVNPSGSCVTLLIQMPILFALYRVIYNMPAYIKEVGNIYHALANKIVAVDNGAFIQNSEVASIANTVKAYGKNMTEGNMENGVIDVLNRLSSSDMALIAEHYNLNGITYNLGGSEQNILSTVDAAGQVTNMGIIDHLNNFLGLNIADSPMFIIKSQWALGDSKSMFIIVVAVLIPLLAGAAQWLNTKLMPQPESDGSQQNDMAASMKYMNNVMPIMSIVMCFSFSVGIGIYWLFGAIVRGVIQVCINKKIDKIDIDAMIEENSKKVEEKRKKYGLPASQISSNAKKNTRNIQANNKPSLSKEDKDSMMKESTEYYKNANINKPGSLASKANMVKQYNEKNNK